MADRIKLRRDTAANWTSTNPVLAQGEPGFETDTGYMKIGDGSTAWASLTYFGGGASGDFVPLAGNVTMTGPLSVPSGASGAQVPQAQEANPPGKVDWFAMNTAPAGWLKANGASVSRTAYAALFAAIGTTFGAGDGSTTFNLPDMRGEFPRGWDDGRGVDSGRVFGSAQQDAFQGHRHLQSLGGTLSTAANTAGTYVIGNQNSSETQDTRTDPAYGTVRQASETRPRNIALLACIKF